MNFLVEYGGWIIALFGLVCTGFLIYINVKEEYSVKSIYSDN